jgi:hypothetical protein
VGMGLDQRHQRIRVRAASTADADAVSPTNNRRTGISH